MLAVISMALVSYGGGNKHKTLAESVREREEKEKAVLDAKLYEPATPAINYGKALPDEKDSFFSLRDYFEVKSVALSQTDETAVPSYVIATVTLEALEDAPEDFNYIYGKITLFDENMLEIKRTVMILKRGMFADYLPIFIIKKETLMYFQKLNMYRLTILKGLNIQNNKEQSVWQEES